MASRRSPIPTPPPAPVYLAFDDRPFRLQMGLRPLDRREWIEIDEEYRDEMAEKERLLAACPDEVVGLLDGADVLAASQEVLDLHVAHLLERFPFWFERAGGGIRCLLDGRQVAVDDQGLAAIDRAGRLVQEDLCVMVPRPHGLVLGAASLCFPNRWRLRDKLGLATMAIHGPVPQYAEQIGEGVDRLLERLLPERPVWRLNWALMDDPALHQPAEHPPTEPCTVDDVLDRVSFRAERQTLRRLPATGAVLFTIRTYRRPLGELCRDPDVARRLAGAIGQLTPEMAAYKSIAPFRDVLLQRLGDLGKNP